MGEHTQRFDTDPVGRRFDIDSDRQFVGPGLERRRVRASPKLCPNSDESAGVCSSSPSVTWAGVS
jgi:hypothetical protein